ncbi:hypothetical protein ACTFIV_003853 [Dictyostelium citrinum]
MIKVASKDPIVFRNRKDAGKQLLNLIKQEVKGLNKENAVVVALPRGGVPVAYEISSALGLPLDLSIPRKIGAQNNPEYAIGAVSEHGEAFINNELLAYSHSSREYVKNEIEKQRLESQRRQKAYKKNRKPIDYKEKTVIIVDDGMATGSTAKSSINSVIQAKPNRIILALPTAPNDSLEEIKDSGKVDEILCVSIPRIFNAVGCFYEIFDQTDDSEVIELLEKSLN